MSAEYNRKYSLLFIILGIVFILTSFVTLSFKKDINPPPKSCIKGGKFVYGIPELPYSLDPKKIIWLREKNILRIIFNNLVVMDNSLTLKGDICETWKMMSDEKTFICKIRKNIKFHDGSNLTADDVIFSLKFILQKDSSISSEFRMIKGIKDFWEGKVDIIKGITKINNLKIKIELEKPVKNFAYLLATPLLVILPENLKGLDESTFFEHPIGTGPFILKHKDKNKIIFKNNKNYFKDKACLDELILYKSTFSKAVKLAEKGIINDINNYEYITRNDLITSITNKNKFLKKIYPNRQSTLVIGFDTLRYPFNNPKTRKALAMSIDKKGLVKKCFNNTEIAASIIPTGIFGHSENRIISSFDPIRAKKYIESTDIKTKIPIYYEPTDINDCMASYINTTFQSLEAPWYLKKASERIFKNQTEFEKIHAYIYRLIIKNEDPYSIFKLFYSKDRKNIGRIQSKKIDSLLELALSENTILEKTAIYQRIDYLLRENFYIIPLLYPKSPLVIDSRFTGNDYTLEDPSIDFTKICRVTIK